VKSSGKKLVGGANFPVQSYMIPNLWQTTFFHLTNYSPYSALLALHISLGKQRKTVATRANQAGTDILFFSEKQEVGTFTLSLFSRQRLLATHYGTFKG
jgi:hypothetical protein